VPLPSTIPGPDELSKKQPVGSKREDNKDRKIKEDARGRSSGLTITDRCGCRVYSNIPADTG